MSSPGPKGWEEKFQDLSGWCSRRNNMTEQPGIVDPAELNTPVLELGYDELQLNFNVLKAETNSVQDIDKSIVGFWPYVDESTLRDIQDSETCDKNKADVNNLLGPTDLVPVTECNGNAPDLEMKTDESTEVLTKLKLNIPGCTSFNDALSTPDIVNLVFESLEPGADCVKVSHCCSANSLDGPDDFQPFVQEQIEGFDLLAYMFEDASKPGVSGLNEGMEKAVTLPLPSPRGKPNSFSWKIREEDKLCSTKQNHGRSPPHLPLPVSIKIYKEETSEEDKSNSKRKQSRKRKFETESLKAREEPAKRALRSCSSTSTSSRPDTPLDVKYRELRDRNNEASKRSRYNRKMRDGEMEKEALRLEKENLSLKLKAEEMERLVKHLRESLLKTIGNRK